MSPPADLPRPQELALWPELAVLVLLQHGLDMTVRALVAAHPELDCPERPHWILTSPAATAAQSILSHADFLSRALARYRLTLPREPNHPPPLHDDCPF